MIAELKTELVEAENDLASAKRYVDSMKNTRRKPHLKRTGRHPVEIARNGRSWEATN